MNRIRRTEAVCLRSARHRETSKLVTLFSPDAGKLVVLAKGARRPRNKFGATLEQFAVSKVIYYWHQERTVYIISDAELVHAFPGLTLIPGRFLAAAQIAEFLLRTLRSHDQTSSGTAVQHYPQLYRLTLAYFDVLETATGGFPALVGSFLLKAASFLGFRPELRRCLRCRKPISDADAVAFDPERGGVLCSKCAPYTVAVPRAGEGVRRTGQMASDALRPRNRWGPTAQYGSGVKLTRTQLATLSRLLYSPGAEIAKALPDEERLDRRAAGSAGETDCLTLILTFVSLHLDPLLLNSFNWKSL